MDNTNYMQENKSVEDMMKVFWIVVWVLNTVILLSLFIDHGRPFIDFLIFITGGDRL